MLKISTWIMLAILVLTCVGFSFIYYAQNRMMNSYNTTSSSDYNYDEQISNLENTKPEGWELEVDKYEFLRDNDIQSGWKYMAVEDLYAIKESNSSADKDMISLLEQAIKNNDWELYFQSKIDTNNSLYKNEDEQEVRNWGYKYYIDNDIEPDEDSWITEVVNNVSNDKIKVYEAESINNSKDSAEIETYKEEIKIGEYRLANNISYNIADLDNDDSLGLYDEDISIWGIMSFGLQLISTVGMIVIVIAGGIVSSEFSAGTIKFLLMNPIKRWKILISKYTTTLLFGIVMLALMYIIFAVMGMVFGGFNELGSSYIYMAGDKVKEISGFAYMLEMYALGFVDVVIMATLAFAISSMIRSSALAIGVSIFIMMAGSTINAILAQIARVDWGRFLIFANTDLVNIMKGNVMYEGQTIGFAVIVLIVHMIVFMLAAWDGFVRREV